MRNKLKSVIVGVVSLLAIVFLIYGIKFLKGQNPFKNDRVFHAFQQDIAGLTEGNSVTIKGYKVGTVTQIYFDSEKDYQLKVLINIENDIQIPINSEAKIVSLDLMGTKGISLVLGNDTVMAIEGSEINSSIEASLQDEVNAQILPLKNKATKFIIFPISDGISPLRLFPHNRNINRFERLLIAGGISPDILLSSILRICKLVRLKMPDEISVS